MKSVAIIHAIRRMMDDYEQHVKAAMPDVIVHNMYDEFFATDPEETGEFSIDNKNRLYHILKAAELTGADAIMIACTNPIVAVEPLRSLIKVPILCINDAMARKAVEYGGKITILATTLGTVAPSTEKIQTFARQKNVEPQIEIKMCKEAFAAMRAGDLEFHDREVKRMAAEIKDAGVVVLAQASMAHLEQEIQAMCDCPVLTSISSSIEHLRETLA